MGTSATERDLYKVGCEMEYRAENDHAGAIFLATTSDFKVYLLRQVMQAQKIPLTVQKGGVSLDPNEKLWEEAYLKGPIGQNGHFFDIPRILAFHKAEMLRQLHPDSPIISADSSKFLNQKFLGKPASPEEAYQMILDQAGQTVTQVAGVAFWNGCQWTFGRIEIAMRIQEITPSQARSYVQETPDVLNTGGAIPIYDPRAFELFSQDSRFPTVIRCYNQRDEEVWVHTEMISARNDSLNYLTLAVYGFSPHLLETMGVFNLAREGI